MSTVEFLRDLYARLTDDGSTSEKAVQGGIWVAGINIGDRALQLLKIVILARLLSPGDFGLLGIALLALAALKQFSQLGFDEALIQHRDENVDDYLDTAWLMKIGRGSLIFVVAYLAAPYLAQFFSEPRTTLLIRVLAISPLLLGLQNPATVYFQKDLNFHKEFAYQMGGRLVDFGVAVAAALIYQNVWALAAGLVAMDVVKLAISYLISNYRPSISFDREYAEEMFGFGKWMFASAILVFLYSQGDDAFVGWFFGATALGFYQLAYRLSNAPATEVTHVISRVAFPAFSKVQDDTKRLRSAYFRTVQISSIVGFPMATGIVIVAPQFVPTVLGNQWESMVPLMQILALWGAMRGFGANVGAVFKAVGRPDYDVRLQTIKVIVIALLIFPAAEKFGVPGVAAIIIMSEIVIQPISIYLVLSVTRGGLRELLAKVCYPLFGCLVMASSVTAVNVWVFSGTGPFKLAVLIALGIASYIVAMYAVERQTTYEFIELYREMRSAL